MNTSSSLENQNTLRVAAVQFESKPADKDANFRKIQHFVELASAERVQLLVFPECCITGYWFIRNLSIAELGDIAEPIPEGPSTQRLIALARKHGISLGTGMVEHGGAGVFYNSYVVALPDGAVQRHRKLHAFEHS